MVTNLPFALIVLDGWGAREEEENNALAAAKTPYIDHLLRTYPHSVLNASEESVGLPEGQIGNSEVGHMTIGAGTIIDTDLVRITKAFRTREGITENAAFKKLFAHVLDNDSTLHILGLTSPGGIHSHQEHLFSFLRAAKEAGITKVAIHAFTDGRDTAPQSAANYLTQLEAVLGDLGIGHIATASGRFYAMDRDNNWDRVEKAGKAIFACEGKQCGAQKASTALQTLYKSGVVDEHLEPLVFLDETGKSCPIEKNDGVFFFNFRADRARMLSKHIAEQAAQDNLCFVTLTQYDPTIPSLAAFPQKKIETTLAAEISRAGLSQVHIAETEKYAHATYFLNGGTETLHPGERNVLIESRKDVKTHDEAPEMRAKEIADAAVIEIGQGSQFLFINFANADMVGHTANVPAVIRAAEEVDTQLKRVCEAILAKGGVAFITADHGNAELNIDPDTQEQHTAHTMNLVPAILTTHSFRRIKAGTLADVAPTILALLSLPIPPAMTGGILLEK